MHSAGLLCTATACAVAADSLPLTCPKFHDSHLVIVADFLLLPSAGHVCQAPASPFAAAERLGDRADMSVAHGPLPSKRRGVGRRQGTEKPGRENRKVGAHAWEAVPRTLLQCATLCWA